MKCKFGLGVAIFVTAALILTSLDCASCDDDVAKDDRAANAEKAKTIIRETKAWAEEVGPDGPRLYLNRIPIRFEEAIELDPTNPEGFIEYSKAGLRERLAPSHLSVIEVTLHWLARMQHYSGGWSVSSSDADADAARHEQNYEADIESTALALLPFLGAGYTHVDGDRYKSKVQLGIEFLASKMKLQDGRGDLRGEHGDMIVHGLAALVICESYAMTEDKRLVGSAQAAVRFIEQQQNADGGWSLRPGDKSDMTVSFWQGLVLHSAAIGELEIAPKTIERFQKFIDSTQTNNSFYFGRTGREKDPFATAAGIFWKSKFNELPQNDPQLRLAATFLANDETQFDDCFAKLAIRLALFHYDDPGGTIWKEFNRKQIDRIGAAQTAAGFFRGTWFNSKDVNGKRGGRLMQTAMNALALEVYYRHLPVFQQGHFSFGDPNAEPVEKDRETTPTGKPATKDPFGIGTFPADPDDGPFEERSLD